MSPDLVLPGPCAARGSDASPGKQQITQSSLLLGTSILGHCFGLLTLSVPATPQGGHRLPCHGPLRDALCLVMVAPDPVPGFFSLKVILAVS